MFWWVLLWPQNTSAFKTESNCEPWRGAQPLENDASGDACLARGGALLLFDREHLAQRCLQAERRHRG